MRLTVDRDVLRRFPATRVALVHLAGLRMPEVPDAGPATEEAAKDLAAALQGGVLDHRHVASWRAVYRGFGTNPNNARPSAEALARRALRSGGLPAILPLVDAYNLVSLRFLLPAGAYDLDRLDGEVCLRFSAGGEPFTGIGASEAEQTNPGEVVYADEHGVLTRHWNHRDAARSCITEGTSRAVVLFEAAGEEIATATLRAALAAFADLAGPAARTVHTAWLDRESPAAELLD